MMTDENSMKNDHNASGQSIFEDELANENGNIPLILAAPHAGAIHYPGMRTRRDNNSQFFSIIQDISTDILALETANNMKLRFGIRPYTIFPKIHRRYVDLNRPIYQSASCSLGRQFHGYYHHTLARIIDDVKDKWDSGLLIDIHGQSADKFMIYRGTNDGLTVSCLLDRNGWESINGPYSILGILEDRGYHVHPERTSQASEDPRFNGGYTVQTYGSHNPSGLDAIQIEFGSALRNKQSVYKTANDFSYALKVFRDHFL